MTPGRIALVIVLAWSAACLTLAAVIFINLASIESPERYLALVFGMAMLYLGGSPIAGLIWPPKPNDPNAPIEVPPLDHVRGRTSYRDDSAKWRNVVLAIGAIFLAATIGPAREQPILYVLVAVAAGVLIGGFVMIWRQLRYGRARLVLDAPARRGDMMRGVITMRGSGWRVAGHNIGANVTLSGAGTPTSADTSVTRDGNEVTVRFSTTIPLVDASEGKLSWQVDLDTREPEHRTTFVIDVA